MATIACANNFESVALDPFREVCGGVRRVFSLSALEIFDMYKSRTSVDLY